MSEAMEENDGQHTLGSQQNGEDFILIPFSPLLDSMSEGEISTLDTSAGTHEVKKHDREAPHSDLFLFPDESGNIIQSPTYPILHSPLITPVPNLTQETDDFCILETPGSGGQVWMFLITQLYLHNSYFMFFNQDFCFASLFQDHDQEPVVKLLSSGPVEIKEDYFSQPLGGSDSSRGAVNFPIPEVRYLIKEISVIWHLYGGKDFGATAFTVSPAKSRG